MTNIGVDLPLLQGESIKTFFSWWSLRVLSYCRCWTSLTCSDVQSSRRACRLQLTRVEVLGRTGGFYPAELVGITDTGESLSPPVPEFRGKSSWLQR